MIRWKGSTTRSNQVSTIIAMHIDLFEHVDQHKGKNASNDEPTYDIDTSITIGGYGFLFINDVKPSPSLLGEC